MKLLGRTGVWLAFAAAACVNVLADPVRVVIAPNASPRVVFGAEKVADALKAVGTDAVVSKDTTSRARDVVIGTRNTPALAALVAAGEIPSATARQEGFQLTSTKAGGVAAVGTDDSGVLYGALELAQRIQAERRLPSNLKLEDAPVMKLRGASIGMQKTYILPGRHVYEYPYTPELFPFFYDREHWREYLDYLVSNRMNTLYLWNGHPFASLVRLKDYPEALEVSEEVFAQNVEMFRWLAQECDKRGIWLVQMFYNIILSKPFAEKHGLKTQLSAVHPLAADYTRKSIAEFVRQYPNVGLLVCLGEALQEINGQVEWCTQVILPGVKDGMKAAGLTQEPPVVIRAHATDPKVVMPAALKVYKNLYTMAKYNGESLTTWEPRGVWQETHQMLAGLGTTHVVNVHILANLEPFRYGAVDFIRKSSLAMRDRLHAGGLHLYPLTYWNWPHSPDATEVPLKQIERDWIWFEAWARYAWNPDVPVAADREYWIGRIAGQFGSREAAAHVLDAYNAAGECAPRLLRRFGITEGNRQTLSLGMTLDQLVEPAKYRPYPELWKSHAPAGERLDEYAEREWNRQPHIGETPPSIVAEVLAFSETAVKAIDAAAPHVTRNREEFERVRNDIRCIRAMSQDYAAKVNAAMAVLRFSRSHDAADMERAGKFLTESLGHYRTLVSLTEKTYRFANSMQTSQRRIPISGGRDGQPANFHWAQVLELYEKEHADFMQKVAAAKAGAGQGVRKQLSLEKASFRLTAGAAETYTVQTGSRVFTDMPAEIQVLAGELNGLTGIRFSRADAAGGKLAPIEFEVDEPVDVLVGFVQSNDKGWRKAPELETDALGGGRGGTEPLILTAATVDGLPAIHVHAFRFGPGRQRLELRGEGAYVVLGVVKQRPGNL